MAGRNGSILATGGSWDRLGRKVILDGLLVMIDCQDAVREARIVPGRRWRADVAWPAHRVAIELQGAVYTAGHHTRGHGYEEDCEKILAAAAEGWRILPLTWPMLAGHLEEIARLLDKVLSCTEPRHHRKG